MNTIQAIFDAHPNRAQARQLGDLGALLQALRECAITSTVCADACLFEAQPQHLRRCIRMNLDCADTCGVTARLVARGTDPDWRVIRAQLQACLAACVACAEECERHSNMHAHCRIAAEACRACEKACQGALGKVPAMEMA